MDFRETLWNLACTSRSCSDQMDALKHAITISTTEADERRIRIQKEERKMVLGNPKNAISKVIFNDPATIVIWCDGSKTVVKCENEEYDPEKGLAMAIAKRFFGNTGSYYDVFRKWLPEEAQKEEEKEPIHDCGNCKYSTQSYYIPPCNTCGGFCGVYDNWTHPQSDSLEEKSQEENEELERICDNCKYRECYGYEEPCSSCLYKIRDGWCPADNEAEKN